MGTSSNDISFLPNKFDNIWAKTQKMFCTEAKSIQDLNNIFYHGNSNLLNKIEKSFPEDGIQFLKVYNNIRELILDINNIFPNGEIKLLKSNTTNKIILTRKQVALIFILGFFNIFDLGMSKMNINSRYDFYKILNSYKDPNLYKLYDYNRKMAWRKQSNFK